MANLPHGKHVAHLAIGRVPTVPKALGPGTIIAVYVPIMMVSNDGGTHGPGVLLSPKEHPGTGMHLFPDAAVWVPTQLMAEAESADGADVQFSHTDDAEFRVWRDFTAAGAEDLAARINLVWGGRPQ